MIPREHLQAEAELFLADLELVFLVFKVAEQRHHSSTKAHSRLSGLFHSLMPPLGHRTSD